MLKQELQQLSRLVTRRVATLCAFLVSTPVVVDVEKGICRMVDLVWNMKATCSILKLLEVSAQSAVLPVSAAPLVRGILMAVGTMRGGRATRPSRKRGRNSPWVGMRGGRS